MSVRVAEGMPLPVEIAGTRCEWCHIVGAPRDPSDRTSLLWWTADATERDPIIALGAMVAEALYGRCVPVLVLDGDDYERVRTWRRARIARTADGVVLHEGAGAPAP